MNEMNVESFIPFNKPHTPRSTMNLLSEVLASGHTSGNGEFSRKVEKRLEEILSKSIVRLTPSCTHALEMSIRVLGIGPGDEVIVPSFTFSSTVNAVVMAGATPVFVDVDSLTFNIDLEAVKSAMTNETKAVIAVHYAGISCDIEQLYEICRSQGVALIEDNAHGLGGTFNGQALGTFGEISTLSFHETKNIHCGEGGAIVINRDGLLEPVEIMREKGTNRAAFFQGQVDKYTWIGEGSSWILSDLLSGILIAQLDEFDEIQSNRILIWNMYYTELLRWSESNGYQLPTVPEMSQHPAHLFYMIAPSFEHRATMLNRLRKRNILGTFHYQSLHSSPAGLRFGRSHGSFKNTDIASDRLLRLPLWPDMSENDVERVIDAVKFK
jgi:dTDP-4-amino-4,6-dideoxygalactose transaminase